MSDGSAIEWTDATWNPVRGCTKVSPGCKHCYAETFAERWRGIKGHPFEQGFDLRLVPASLDKPLTWRAPRKIFVNSMSDLFHEDVPNEYIAAVFGVMASCPQHQFQVLTKRAERMRDWFRWMAREVVHVNADVGAPAGFICLAHAQRYCEAPQLRQNVTETSARPWPLPNVWLGVSIENADFLSRIDRLLDTPAAVRFLSLEPLLGPIALNPGWLGCVGDLAETFGNPLIHWVIVGGESGPGARPMDPAWVRSLRDTVVDAGAALFFKQWGGVRKKLAGRELDGRTWDEFPADRAEEGQR